MNALQAGTVVGEGDEVRPKLVVELPTPWLDSPNDGEKHQAFFVNLVTGCSDKFYNFRVERVDLVSENVTVPKASHEIWLSYHSVGNQKNVWRLKEAPIFPYYSFDRRGYSGWSEIAQDEQLQQKAFAFNLAKADCAIKRIAEGFKRTRQSKYAQGNDPVSVEQGYIFFPLQVASDPVAQFARFPATEALVELARLAEAYEIPLVVKRHPLCTSELISEKLDQICEQSQYVVRSDANIHDLIESCRAVFTVNSGVGFEAMIHGKPVYCSGLSEWSAAAVNIHRVKDLKRMFTEAPVPQSESQRRYIGFLLLDYWFDATSRDDVARILNRALAEFNPSFADTDHPVSLGAPSRLDIKNYKLSREKMRLKAEVILLKSQFKIYQILRRLGF